MRRPILVVVPLSLVALVGCQSGIGRDPERPRATIQAYETEVARLRRQVEAQRTTVTVRTPPADRSTPTPFRHQWRIEVTGPIERRERVGVREGVTAVPARGDFVVVPVLVTNLTMTPAVFNPAQHVLLVDGRGRRYQLDARGSGAAYLLDFGYEPVFAPRQPGIPYPDVLVFDVASEAEDLVLRSADGSFPLDLAVPGATPSP